MSFRPLSRYIGLYPDTEEDFYKQLEEGFRPLSRYIGLYHELEELIAERRGAFPSPLEVYRFISY